MQTNPFMAHRPLSLVLAVALTACGGRTSLLDVGMEPPPACSHLVVTGAPLALPDDDTPKLVRWTEDGARVGVIHPLIHSHATPAVSEILASPFAPWGEWPSSLPPGITACSSCETEPYRFRVSPARPAAETGISMLAVHVTDPEGAQPSFEPTFHPAIPAGAPPVPVPGLREPSGLARGAAGHLLAYEHGLVPSTLRLAYVSTGSGVLTTLGDVGCGTGLVSVIPVQGGFLVSFASGVGGVADGCVNPALTVVRVDESTGQIAVTATIPDTQLVRVVWLARLRSGAWLVYQPTSLHTAPDPLRAVRLTESGAIDGPVVEISDDGDSVSAAGVMGSRLVLAGVHDLESSPHALQIITLNDDGQVQRASFDVSPTLIQFPKMLISPDEKQLLIGYTGKVLRLGCAPEIDVPGGPLSGSAP